MSTDGLGWPHGSPEDITATPDPDPTGPPACAAALEAAIGCRQPGSTRKPAESVLGFGGSTVVF
jgi:hypothetical protein